MALQISLVWINNTTDLDEMSLVDFTDGFMPAQNGWVQQVATDEQRSVIEAMTLQIRAASDDDLAAKIQSLDLWKKRVAWSRNTAEVRQVWLRAAIEDETEARQAQVLDLNYALVTSLLDQQVVQFSLLRSLTLALERTPYWEDVAPYPTTTAITSLGSCGGIKEMSETIYGDVPARLALLNSTPHSPAQMGEFWIGWKSDQLGDPANFQPVWSLDKSIFIGTGYTVGADTTVAADVTAVDGNKVVCTFATVPTLSQRTITQVNDVVSDSDEHTDQRGTYLVLLRAKMTDTSIARVRMLYSFSNNLYMKSPVYNTRQIISGTYWKLYPMGTAVIPSMRIIPGLLLSNAAISLQAERASGSGSLEMDCLVLIPMDDGAVHMASALTENLTNGFYLRVIQNADDSIYTISSSSTYIYYPSTVEPMLYKGLVANSSKPYIVTAGQRYVSTTSQNTFTDLIDVTYTYIPRWRTLRGAI